MHSRLGFRLIAHTKGIQAWSACDSLLATRRGSQFKNQLTTLLILSVSITWCHMFLLLKGIISFHYHYEASSKPISFHKQNVKGILSLWNNIILNATKVCCDRPNTKYNNLRDVKYGSKQRLLTWLLHVNDFSLKFRHNEYSMKLQWSWLGNYQY